MTINSGRAEGSGLGSAGGSSHYLGWKDKKKKQKEEEKHCSREQQGAATARRLGGNNCTVRS